MAIATRMVGVPLPSAAVTLVEVAAEFSGSAGEQSLYDPSMPLRHGLAIGPEVLLAVSTQDVGDFEH